MAASVAKDRPDPRPHGLTIPSGTRAARLGMIGLALLIAATLIRSGIADRLADRRPELAWRIAPGNGHALARYGDGLMTAARSEADAARVEAIARATIARSPLEAAALRNIGLVAAARRGDAAAARPWLDLATRLSLRDLPSHLWLFDQHRKAGDAAGAIAEADLMLRQNDAIWPTTLGTLAQVMLQPGAVAPMARTLTRRPEWRGSFLVVASQAPGSREPLFRLFRRMTQLGSPPTTDEITAYFASPVRWDDPAMPFAYWRQLVGGPLADPALLIRDGGFAGNPAPPPFNWRFFDRDGGTAQIAPRPDGRGNLLAVSLDGNHDLVLAQQMLVLRPGRYRLRTLLGDAGRLAAGQLIWSIACVGRPSAIDVVPVDPHARILGDQMISIPAECPLQQLSLEGRSVADPVPATAAIDAVGLTRAGP